MTSITDQLRALGAGVNEHLDLKPCPYCGSRDVYVESAGIYSRHRAVMCEDCQSHGPVIDPTKHDDGYAIELWNDRV